MKRFFFTIFIFLLFLIPASLHATTFPYSKTVSGITTDISITSTATTASIAINIKNPNKVSIQNKKLVVYSNSTCQAPFLLNETISMTRIDTLSKTFFVGKTTPLKPDTTYCFRYSDTGWANETFKTDTIVPPTSFADAWPLTPSTLGDKSAILGGKIDVSKYTADIKNLTIELQYSSTPDTFDKKVQSLSNTTTNAVGIASDGTYYFNLGTTLTPGATYYIREVLTDTVSAHTEQKTATFVNTDKGLALEGSVAEQNYFEKKSYRLLAPFPGLAVLLDPSQCAALSAEELAGKICSINDLLNFIFKVLIGVTAVILVFRLVFEGYTILTTDVPFLNVKAKNGFFTALAGLLLALSAWLILNTVNPKLVSNEFSIEGVAVGVEEAELQDALEVQTSGGGEGTIQLCTSVASCKKLCTDTNNGSTYKDAPPGVMSASLAKKIESVPLVSLQKGCINCTASANVVTGLKNLKPAIDTLLSQNQIPPGNYTFEIVSAYRPAKDQIRVMCDNIYSNPGELGSKYAFPAKSNHGVGTAVDFRFFRNGIRVYNCAAGRTSKGPAIRAEGTIEKIMDKAGFQRLNNESWHFEYGGGKQTCKYPNCVEPKHCTAKI